MEREKPKREDVLQQINTELKKCDLNKLLFVLRLLRKI